MKFVFSSKTFLIHTFSDTFNDQIEHQEHDHPGLEILENYETLRLGLHGEEFTEDN